MIVEGTIEDARECVADIQLIYSVEGYNVRVIQEQCGFLVLINSDCSGFWGGIKSFVGIDRNVTLSIRTVSTGLELKVTSDYRSKIAKSAFVAALTGGVVVCTPSMRQRDLEKEVIEKAIDRLRAITKINSLSMAK